MQSSFLTAPEVAEAEGQGFGFGVVCLVFFNKALELKILTVGFFSL